jgi:hypothetical protein
MIYFGEVKVVEKLFKKLILGLPLFRSIQCRWAYTIASAAFFAYNEPLAESNLQLK